MEERYDLNTLFAREINIIKTKEMTNIIKYATMMLKVENNPEKKGAFLWGIKSVRSKGYCTKQLKYQLAVSKNSLC